jgi:hypothetical protein
LINHRRGEVISEYLPSAAGSAARVFATRFAEEHQNRSSVDRALTRDRESNMRASTAYFAGAGTVIAAIVAGVGGGLVIADIISPKSPKQGTELSRLERRMSSEPIQAASGPSEPV